ncbi:translation initiation factor IF-1 [Candidatus Collierbacteria bacterium]|nr:translation initiation factor IF-1 [Candidatus Collierbacteria bacterium]
MPGQNLIIGEGEIIESLPNTLFRVKIDDNVVEEIRGKTILCTLSGKMRMYRISVMPGDRVRIEVSPYDLNRGRITYRQK